MDAMGVALVPRFGGKGSNLARLQTVLGGAFDRYRESGFVIPVSCYLDFMRANLIPSRVNPARQVTFEEFIDEIVNDARFRSDWT